MALRHHDLLQSLRGQHLLQVQYDSGGLRLGRRLRRRRSVHGILGVRERRLPTAHGSRDLRRFQRLHHRRVQSRHGAVLLRRRPMRRRRRLVHRGRLRPSPGLPGLAHCGLHTSLCDRLLLLLLQQRQLLRRRGRARFRSGHSHPDHQAGRFGNHERPRLRQER